MAKVDNYREYMNILSELKEKAEFENFHSSVNRKIGYSVSELRAMELIMFMHAPSWSS